MPNTLLQTNPGITNPSVPDLCLKNYSKSKLLDPVSTNTNLSDKIASTDRLLWQIHETIKKSVEVLKRNMHNTRVDNQGVHARSNFVEICLGKPLTYRHASDGLVEICLDEIRKIALDSKESAEAETIKKGLDVLARNFSPIQVNVSASHPANASVHPLAGRLFTEGSAHLQTLHLALKAIEKTIDDSAQRSAYLKQIGTIIQHCAVYFAQDACVEGKLSELQRAATRARQLLSNDVLKSMLRKQFTDILINITQSTLANSDTNPITDIVNQQKIQLKMTIAERAPQMGIDYNQTYDIFNQVDLTSKEARDWFLKCYRGDVVHRVNALMGSLKKDLPLEEANIADRYAEDLTTERTPRKIWINTAYRRLLNQQLAGLHGALHPLTVIDRLTEELIQDLKNSTPDTEDRAFYPALQAALASVEPALGEVDIKRVIDMDPMTGKCQWNENLHENLSKLITQTAWQSGLIHPDFTVAIRPDNRIIVFDRDKAHSYGSSRSIAQNHSCGLLIFTDNLKNAAPKLIKFGGDEEGDQTTDDQATDAPTRSAQAELAVESALALCFGNPLEHEGSEILKRLNMAAHAADEQSRNTLYGDRQKLIDNLSRLFERYLRKPEDLKKPSVSDLIQTLFQKEHHELLSNLLTQNRTLPWVKPLERALSDAALTHQHPDLDKTAVRQFLISHGAHVRAIKTFPNTEHYARPQYNLDALLSAENADFLETLLDAGIINPDIRTDQVDPYLSNGKTLLIHAIKHGSPKSVELLCKRGAAAKDRSFTSLFSGQEKNLFAAFKKHAHRFSEPNFISRCIFEWMQKRSEPSVKATLRR